MSKRNTTGRVTVEEVDALFQKPLRLLHRRAVQVQSPQASRQPDLPTAEDPMDPAVAQPERADTESRATGTTHIERSSAESTVESRGGWLDWLQSAARRMSAHTTDAAHRQRELTGTASSSVLVARLEENLLEASSLAAELHRRHRESQAEYERAISDLHNLTSLLVDQIDPASRQGGPQTSNQ